jgi:hypothetical protein
MFAGKDTAPVFDIIDRIRAKLVTDSDMPIENPTVQQIRSVVAAAWREELNFRTTQKFLGKREGWTLGHELINRIPLIGEM